MKKVKLFEEYVEVQDEIFNLDENQYDDTIEDLDSIIENFENAEEINEGLFTAVAGLILIRQAYKFLRKRAKIKKMLAASDLDPAQKEKLKKELKKLKYDEVKAIEKIEKQKEQMRAKEEAKKKGMSPEQKEKFQKEIDKKQKELDKAKAKFDKEKEKLDALEA